jgi:4-hydroxybenzoate polyprenyltransferase
MPSLLARTRTTLEMIKWEHSIFALPFALTAVLLAADGLPDWRLVLPMKLVWILVAMVAARSSAMAFNRWADAELDAANPRTKRAPFPPGCFRAILCWALRCLWRRSLSRRRRS